MTNNLLASTLLVIEFALSANGFKEPAYNGIEEFSAVVRVLGELILLVAAGNPRYSDHCKEVVNQFETE